MLFSEPKIPQFFAKGVKNARHSRFQCSSASRKFLNFTLMMSRAKKDQGFSALQRAENSSIFLTYYWDTWERTFQCSSASRKFLNRIAPSIPRLALTFQCSSASRKFLNSKPDLPFRMIVFVSVLFSEPKIPQFDVGAALVNIFSSFSALQRAENSSI